MVDRFNLFQKDQWYFTLPFRGLQFFLNIIPQDGFLEFSG